MTKWKLQLVSPEGEVLSLGELSNVHSIGETSIALMHIESYLQSEQCNWVGKQFVLLDLHQMLLNNDFHEYHNFRLVWGTIPQKKVGEFAQWPNGKDTQWHLCYESNGRVQECLSGELPEGWWELSEEDRDHQLQNILFV